MEVSLHTCILDNCPLLFRPFWKASANRQLVSDHEIDMNDISWHLLFDLWNLVGLILSAPTTMDHAWQHLPLALWLWIQKSVLSLINEMLSWSYQRRLHLESIGLYFFNAFTIHGHKFESLTRSMCSSLRWQNKWPWLLSRCMRNFWQLLLYHVATSKDQIEKEFGRSLWVSATHSISWVLFQRGSCKRFIIPGHPQDASWLVNAFMPCIYLTYP